MSASPWNKVNLFIAKQYLMSRRRQSFLAILGVVFGVATFTVLLGFMTGVNDFLDDAVFKGNPDLVVSPQKQHNSSAAGDLGRVYPLFDVPAIENELIDNENVEAFSRQVITPAILISDSQQLPVRINGVYPDLEKEMVDLDRRLTAGEGFNSINKSSSILLGRNLAEQLGVVNGDKVRVVLPNKKSIQLKVSGIFSFGISTIDNIRAYMNAGRLEHLLSDNALTTHIHIKLIDRENLDVKAELLDNFKKIEVTDWQEGNKTIVVGNRVRHVLTWTISFALLLVAGFGIFNILNITVIQKRKDIAVLRTVGYRNSDITTIFSLQALIIGLTGAVIGVIAGYLISLWIASVPLETADFIIAENYPVNFNLEFYLIGLLFGVLTSFVSGYFPARKASTTDPVKIIRGL